MHDSVRPAACKTRGYGGELQKFSVPLEVFGNTKDTVGCSIKFSLTTPSALQRCAEIHRSLVKSEGSDFASSALIVSVRPSGNPAGTPVASVSIWVSAVRDKRAAVLLRSDCLCGLRMFGSETMLMC
jgi:hypothetical protein